MGKILFRSFFPDPDAHHREDTLTERIRGEDWKKIYFAVLIFIKAVIGAVFGAISDSSLNVGLNVEVPVFHWNLKKAFSKSR